MSCDIFQKALEEYLAQKKELCAIYLSYEIEQEMDKHIDACPFCRKQIIEKHPWAIIIFIISEQSFSEEELWHMTASSKGFSKN